MSIETVTEPASEPITTAEAKSHLRIEWSEEDTYIDTLIAAAREYVETYCDIALLTQTLRLTLDGFPSSDLEPIFLPKPPVQSITSIKYYDTGNVLQTWSLNSPQEYQDDISDDSPTTPKRRPTRIMPGYGYQWPDVYPTTFDAVEIEYITGWRTAGEIPDRIKHAVKIMVSDWYHNRDDTVVTLSSPRRMPAINRLLDPFRVKVVSVR